MAEEAAKQNLILIPVEKWRRRAAVQARTQGGIKRLKATVLRIQELINTFDFSRGTESGKAKAEMVILEGLLRRQAICQSALTAVGYYTRKDHVDFLKHLETVKPARKFF